MRRIMATARLVSDHCAPTLGCARLLVTNGRRWSERVGKLWAKSATSVVLASSLKASECGAWVSCMTHAVLLPHIRQSTREFWRTQWCPSVRPKLFHDTYDCCVAAGVYLVVACDEPYLAYQTPRPAVSGTAVK
jgi:hypothetical protein